MGFGNIATTLIMFIAVMLIATGVIITIRTDIEQTTNSMQVQSDYLNNQLQTNIQITQTNYSAGNTTIYVINNGKTTLKTSKIDAYLDAEFIPRNDTHRAITLEPSTDVRNPGLWDPDEIIKIDIYRTLQAGEHVVAVTTQYGNKDEELFST